MCSRGSSQIIKIVLVMLISGIILSEKHLKTYHLGLWFFLPLKVREASLSISDRLLPPPPPFPVTYSPNEFRSGRK